MGLTVQANAEIRQKTLQQEESQTINKNVNRVNATLSDKIYADKTAENLTYCRNFCPPKYFVH